MHGPMGYIIFLIVINPQNTSSLMIYLIINLPWSEM